MIMFHYDRMNLLFHSFLYHTHQSFSQKIHFLGKGLIQHGKRHAVDALWSDLSIKTYSDRVLIFKRIYGQFSFVQGRQGLAFHPVQCPKQKLHYQLKGFDRIQHHP